MPSSFYVMVGLPGSGKSTYALSLKESLIKAGRIAVIVSTDEIRKQLFKDEACQKNNTKVFNIAHKKIGYAMAYGYDVIFDATNIKRKSRKNLLKEFYDYASNYMFKAIVIATPFEKCLLNNQQRKRVVPEEVIKRMLVNFQVPIYNEGWDDITVVNPFYDWAPDGFDNYFDYCMNSCRIPHDCEPYHTGLISDHIEAVSKLMKENETASGFIEIGEFHDIGKPYVKAYSEKKNRYVYYGHPNVSSYIYCCCKHDSFSVSYAFIIENHMMAHQFATEELCREALSKHWDYDPEDIELIIKFGKYDKAGALPKK